MLPFNGSAVEHPNTQTFSLRLLFCRSNSIGFDSFYEYGWWCDYDVPTLNKWADSVSNPKSSLFLEEALDSIRQIKALCSENQIELIVFVNPVSDFKLKNIDQEAFKYFLSELAQITPYYNFSGRNDITVSPSSYVDNGHCSAAVGDIILDRICSGEIDPQLLSQGFGALITAENRMEILESIWDDSI